MAGFREFLTGEVLTAANVDDFLMKQSVQKYADAAARDAALGTAVAGGNALREGMVAWLDDTDSVIAYDGTAWNPVGAAGGFDDLEVIIATNASWPVPSLGSPIVKVTVIGGGGGGGGADGGNGTTGGTTTFNTGSDTVTALGGPGGRPGFQDGNGFAGRLGFVSGNGGMGGHRRASSGDASTGGGGEITVAYLDLTGISTVNVTIGAGGAPGSVLGSGATGGRGEVIVEYKAA